MGRYLDLARDAKAAGNCGKEVVFPLQWEEQAQSQVLADIGYEINEINEISPPGQGYEINEISPIGGVPLCPTGGRAVLLQVPDGVPAEWVQGVADLLAMPPHAAWPEPAWRVLREDALTFLKDWAAQADALGWDALALFGVHAAAPHARLDGMGLVPLLGGRPVIALTEDAVGIRAGSGGTQTFRRHRSPPPGRCLVWELECPS